MKKLMLLCVSSLILTACNTAPVAMMGASAPVPTLRSASTPSEMQPEQSDGRYGFRKPTAYLKVDLYVARDKEIALNHIQEFFRKYVDKNDIFNYQTLHNDTDEDKFIINIYGGNQDFVYKSLLPDLRFYLQQRMRFDNLSFYTGY